MMDFHSPQKQSSAEPTLPAMIPPSSNTNTNTTPTMAGTKKRSAASLLPAFEPLSSSPGLPRPAKRQNTGGRAHLKYPTPVPTSSTGILSSSPPNNSGSSRVQQRTERTPLSDVPAVELSENGETLIMGRSSNSSHFQLSANRLVSRVHVRARFIAATSPLEPNKMEIVCNGWNGLKLHCQSRTWELFKGDSFTSETEGSEIMVDVQDARVLVQWPKRGIDHANLSDSTWDDSPRSQARGGDAVFLQSSPLRRGTRIASPESPTPATASSRRLQALLPDPNITIYEDDHEPEPELPEPKREPMDVNVSMKSEATASFTSEISEGERHDPDEENDPIVHSFGPFGADISGRLASITTKSPKVFKAGKRPALSTVPEVLASQCIIPSEPLLPKRAPSADSLPSSPPLANSPTPTPEPPKKSIEANPAVANHVVNQLAYSRLSSTPLSAIMHNLPTEEKRGLLKSELREIIEATVCIGIIERQGKDAAGKALESEYYYIPEQDMDLQRRFAVVDGLRKPSLRACRKQHKVRTDRFTRLLKFSN